MVVYIILILVLLFIWWRMLSDLKNRPRIAVAVVVLVLSLITCSLVYLIFSMTTYKGEFATPENVCRYLVFGTVSALIITVGVFYVISSTVTLILRRYFKRRLSGIVWTNLAVAGVIVLLFADSHFRQRFRFRVVEQEVTIPVADPGIDGLRIAFITDMHLASFYGHYDKLREVTVKLNSLKPDIIINGGDFISYGYHEYANCDTIMAGAAAPSGNFAVAGNHDDGTYHPSYTESYGIACKTELKRKIEASGYTLLNDTSVIFRYKGLPVTVAGVVTYGHHLNVEYGDFDKALAGSDSASLLILVMHNPAGWDEVQGFARRPDLTLSGHTHGLQIGLPLPGKTISPASAVHKYWRGLYEMDNSFLFVSSGLGSMGMTSRIFMPPEIVIITIRSYSDDAPAGGQIAEHVNSF